MSGFNTAEKPAIPPQPVQPAPQPLPPSQGKYLDEQNRLLINRQGLELTKHFEALYLQAYKDPGPRRTVTIGWGTIIYPDGRKVRMGDECTPQEAEGWLMLDLWGDGAKYVRAYLDDGVENELNENQFSALVSLTYNRGAGRFRQFVAPHLNKRDFPAALNAMVALNWSSADDGSRHYLLGLDRRRWAERYLFEGKDWGVFRSVQYFKDFKANGYKPV